MMIVVEYPLCKNHSRNKKMLTNQMPSLHWKKIYLCLPPWPENIETWHDATVIAIATPWQQTLSNWFQSHGQQLPDIQDMINESLNQTLRTWSSQIIAWRSLFKWKLTLNMLLRIAELWMNKLLRATSFHNHYYSILRNILRPKISKNTWSKRKAAALNRILEFLDDWASVGDLIAFNKCWQTLALGWSSWL